MFKAYAAELWRFVAIALSLSTVYVAFRIIAEVLR